MRVGEGGNLGVVAQGQISGFCRLFRSIAARYPQLVANIRPVYLKESGLAVCTLYINGGRTEVVIDDLVPLERMCYGV